MPAQPQSPGFFTELVVGYRRAKTVFLAVDLGVFKALAAGDGTVSSLADELAVEARCLSVVIDALVAMGLVEKRGERLALTDFSRRYLDESAASYVGNNLRFQNQVWPGWSDLDRIVRKGEPWQGLVELLNEPQFLEAYILGMLPVAEGASAAVASLLAEVPYERVLDVGCGPGAYGMALKRLRQAADVTLFDLPSTLVVTKRVVTERTGAVGFHFQAGNYLEQSFGTGKFDLVLMSHVTHDESPDDTQRMVDKAFTALTPGGRLAIHDWVLDPHGETDEWAALFAMHVMTYTRRGKVYTRAEYERHLTQSGFTKVEHRLVGDSAARSPTSLLVGTKP